MKIKLKMALTFTLLNLVIFIVLLGSTVYLSESQADRRFRQELENTTEAVSIQIINLLNKTISDFLLATSTKSSSFLKVLNNNVSKSNLTLKTAQNMFIESINEHIKTSNGTCIITDNNGKIIFHENSSLIGSDSVYKNWIKSNIKKHYIYTETTDTKSNKKRIAIKFYFSNWDWQIIYQMDYEEVYSILDFDSFNTTINNIKVGITGYPYIISTHGLFITHPDEKLRYDGHYNIKDNDGNLFLRKIIKNKEGFLEYNWKDPDEKVRIKVAHFKPIENTHWIVISGGYKDDFFRTTDLVKKLLTIITVISIVVSLMFTLLFSSRLVVPIVKLNNAIKDISEGEGDLTKSVSLKSRDEIGNIASSLNDFIDKLKNIILQIKEVSGTTIKIKEGLSTDTDETNIHINSIDENMTEINSKVKNLEQTVDKASGNVSDITTSIGVLGEQIISQNAMIEESSAAITEMISSIDSVADITSKKQAVTGKLVETTQRGVNIVEQSMESVNRISEQLEGINSMATIISNIASETNILAMNAAIEAAHAGESGKGFAVVAEEIRKLAESSDDSSKRIKDLLNKVNDSMDKTSSLSDETISSIQEIETEINNFVLAFDEISHSTSELRTGGKEMTEAIEVLRDISITVKESSDSINALTDGVNTAMVETGEVSRDIITRISQISNNADKIKSSMVRVNSNTKELANAGDELDAQVNKFKV